MPNMSDLKISFKKCLDLLVHGQAEVKRAPGGSEEAEALVKMENKERLHPTRDPQRPGMRSVPLGFFFDGSLKSELGKNPFEHCTSVGGPDLPVVIEPSD